MKMHRNWPHSKRTKILCIRWDMKRLLKLASMHHWQTCSAHIAFTCAFLLEPFEHFSLKDLFQVVILVLVGLDCILVFGELMIDYLRLFQNHACNATQGSYANESTKELENYHTLETIEKV